MSSPVIPRQIADDTYLLVEAGLSTYGSTSVYLIWAEQPAVVETGPAKQVESILRGLAALRLDPAKVSYIVPTHIHMDHGGGVGLLSQRLPTAKAVVCTNGVRHVVDPSRLIAGTKAYFGEDYADRYGPILPVSSDRVLALCEGDVLDLGGGHRLSILHTPGHAPHHHSLYDSGSGVLFPGEAAGVYLADPGVVIPCSGPGSFDVEATLGDIARLGALDARAVAYSHWGVGDDARRLMRDVALRTSQWGDAMLAAVRAAGEGFDLDGQVALGTAAFAELALVAVAERSAPPALLGHLKAELPAHLSGLTVRGYVEYYRKRGLL